MQNDYNSRRKNIRISGMEERSGGGTWEQTGATVGSLFEKKLQMAGLQHIESGFVTIRGLVPMQFDSTASVIVRQ